MLILSKNKEYQKYINDNTIPLNETKIDELTNQIVNLDFDNYFCSNFSDYANNANNMYNFYHNFYESKYKLDYDDPRFKPFCDKMKSNDSEIFEQINRYASKYGDRIETKNPSPGYTYILFDDEKIKDPNSRIYIACHPYQLKNIVLEITKKALERNQPLYFKYQDGWKWNGSKDRIIIYSNDKNSDFQIIQEIFKEHPEYFNGCEEAPNWFYGVGIPGVYITPGTHESYGEMIDDTMNDVISILAYLKGVRKEQMTGTLEQDRALIKCLIESLLVIKNLVFYKGYSYERSNKYFDFFLDGHELLLSICVKTDKDDDYKYIVFDASSNGKRALVDNFMQLDKIEYGIGVRNPRTSENTRSGI